MDSALKQMIAIGLICALIGGIVGGLAVSLIDGEEYGEAELLEIKEKDQYGRVYMEIAATNNGYVDIYYHGMDVEYIDTVEVRKGVISYPTSAPDYCTLERMILVWHP